MRPLIPVAAAALCLTFGTPREWDSFDRLPSVQHDTVTVRVIGDVMLHSSQMDAARRGVSGTFDFHPFLDSIAADLSSASLTVANMEFTLAGEPYSGYPEFSAPDAYATYVRDCGVDVFLTANNHICDKGPAGLARTYAVYDTLSGVHHVSSNPAMLRVRGINFALINFTYGTNRIQDAGGIHVPLMSEKTEIAAAVACARERKADFVIAFPHWGEEYRLLHGKPQEEMAKFLAETGVDAVVGAHSHCVQDTAVVGGMPVYYSIGNAVSNMSAPNTQLELMVTLRFVRGSDLTLRMIEPEHEWLWCSRPGGFNDGYCVIKIKDYMGRRGEWRNPADYDRMMETLDRVSKIIVNLHPCL